MGNKEAHEISREKLNLQPLGYLFDTGGTLN